MQNILSFSPHESSSSDLWPVTENTDTDRETCPSAAASSETSSPNAESSSVCCFTVKLFKSSLGFCSLLLDLSQIHSFISLWEKAFADEVLAMTAASRPSSSSPSTFCSSDASVNVECATAAEHICLCRPLISHRHTLLRWRAAVEAGAPRHVFLRD